MLNFDAFRDYVGENVLDSFPENLKGAEVRIEKVAKANTERYGLTLRVEGVAITPNLYLESYYEDYRSGDSLDEVMDRIAENYQKALSENTLTDDVVNIYSAWEIAKEHIVFDLVGREQNAELISNRPNRDFLDLSIVYRIVISVDERGMASTPITNDLMKSFGVTEQDLYEVAYENTKEIYKPKVASLVEILGPMIGENLGPCPLFIASNEVGVNGAVVMIYDDVLQELADRAMGPLYDEGDKRELIIFPSSRHEVLALNANATDGPEISYCQEMVEEINMNCVAIEDRLSNNVYKYDAISHELSMATDVPNKRLDGMEQDMSKTI